MRAGYIYMILFYVIFIVAFEFLLPVFLPRYSAYFGYVPIFFFFPFFMFGRRYSGSEHQHPTPTSDSDKKDNMEDYQYDYRNNNYDEFGIPKRHRDSIFFYALGFAILIVAIIVFFLKIPL